MLISKACAYILYCVGSAGTRRTISAYRLRALVSEGRLTLSEYGIRHELQVEIILSAS